MSLSNTEKARKTTRGVMVVNGVFAPKIFFNSSPIFSIRYYQPAKIEYIVGPASSADLINPVVI